MKAIYTFVLEKNEAPFIQNIETHCSKTQADKIFYSLVFGLSVSHYTKVSLFLGEKVVNVATFNSHKFNSNNED